jgi:Nucleotidyltransferase domain
MRHLAADLIRIPGVVAVALGGSRATGTATAASDWDFGLYYRSGIDTDAVRRLGWPGRVFEPGEWGRIVNGGAWLEVGGQKVDLIYRDLDAVSGWTSEAERGRFEIQREVGYVAGIATYVLVGELAVNEVLAGELPTPTFPDALRETAPPRWNRLAGGAMHFARLHLARGDLVAASANLGQAVLAAAQARLAASGEWALNEKGIVERAGLGDANVAIAQLDPAAAIDQITQLLESAGPDHRAVPPPPWR